MDIACSVCKSRYRISDDKIASSPSLTFSCPNCKNKINIDVKGMEESKISSSRDENVYYDAAEKPFDFIRQGEKTALICIGDITLKKMATETLHGMGYHITDSENSRDALRSMWYHTYPLVITDEFFDTENPEQNRVLSYLEGLNMGIRRKMVVALISRTHRTKDHMTAFQKSVNLIINIKHMNELERLLAATIDEHKAFYRVFDEYYKKEISY
ncbi:MAG: hypothetical protein AB1659_04940 [Thermodesulfobacteriota bacterium]